MSAPRLKSSFIYLGNAVNDLTGNWLTMGAVLAPLIVICSLCLLPDAINLQRQVVERLQAPGVHNVALYGVQTPYAPAVEPSQPLFPRWVVLSLRLVSVFLTLTINHLLVLCLLARIHGGESSPRQLDEMVEVYRRAIARIGSFLWIMLLQMFVIFIAFLPGFLSLIWPYFSGYALLLDGLLLIPTFLVFIWLYFSQYALVFEGLRSWAALLRSRELMRGRFFKVATRIVVFLAVWSGFNSWVAAFFAWLSLLLGGVGVLTGAIAGSVFLGDLLSVTVVYATTAFFFAAGVRLYYDLGLRDGAEAVAMSPTVPLNRASA